MSKRLLIAGAGANQIGIIRHAVRLGLRVIAVDGSAHAPGLAEASEHAVADIANGEALLAIARAYKVDGIFPAAEWGVEAAAYATELLGLPGPSRAAARCLRSKYALRNAMAGAGLPVPSYVMAATLAEAVEGAGHIGLPVIVKPADGNASRGVQRVDYIEDVSLAFANAQKAARNGQVLLEAFLHGPEFNVDGIMHQGRCLVGGITGKELSDNQYRYDMGIYMPPRLDHETQQQIGDCVGLALQALGVDTGIFHGEVILTPQGPRIVEIAGRPGGGRIPSDLIPLTYGVDFLADAFRVVLGEKPSESRRFERGAALYWIPSHSGIVTAIEGVEEAAAMEGVVDIVVNVKPGDALGHVVDCVTRDSIGYVLAAGGNVEESIARAESAAHTIRIVTQPHLA
ncbi:MAG: ATP-grasp domain-containing protein [Candidatus Hydrogenedentes bacterium]|nr:ATP-grasp domain-containing protein [Candidatus Hydrogenedentota bacterium]